MESTTICAIATGQGGAIGIIRISGPNAITYTDKIFRPSRKGKSLADANPFTLTYGQIVDTEEKTIDDVLISVFHAPHSYTGENAIEISCHNSPYILQQIMHQLIDVGCQLAAPGEYTQRAFLNGKMDLSQAEAVADVIASTTASAHRLAINQLRNGFSKDFKLLRDKLLKISSLMELELDFSDHEELEFADRSELINLLHDIESKISKLADSFHYGNAIKKGIPVAIIGETNVGKSTLLNTLLGEEKAIVSDIQGTTRDIIEDTFNINGYLFRFIDTAGIRDTDNTIEKIGIERTYKKMTEASIILWIVDAAEILKSKSLPILKKLEEYNNILLVCNKYDLVEESEKNILNSILAESKYAHICISAKDGSNIEQLKQMLLSLANIHPVDDNEYTVTNIRQYNSLKSALQCAERTEDGLKNNLPTDLVSEDLRECLQHLGEIIGTVTSADILHNIFSHFCVGK